MPTATSPSTAIWTGAGAPPGATNWGRMAAKNTIAFGFATPTTTPSRKTERRRRTAISFPSAAARPLRCRTAWMPSHTR